MSCEQSRPDRPPSQRRLGISTAAVIRSYVEAIRSAFACDRPFSTEELENRARGLAQADKIDPTMEDRLGI